MNYSTIIPNLALQHVVECYWTVVGDNTEQQKIVPDGFPEIIFHFGDEYELIDKNGTASRQEKRLISGQIARPILLRPTGKSDVFGIKFKPAGIWSVLGIEMHRMKDQIAPLDRLSPTMVTLYNELGPMNPSDRLGLVEEFLMGRQINNADEISHVIQTIDNANGNISMEVLCARHNLTVRTLQRMFQQQVGITAKQYARIVRFRSVYALMQKPSLSKADSLYLAGYFDQPHFNKEFREFTNDNPDKWFSMNHDFSNLFMNR